MIGFVWVVFNGVVFFTCGCLDLLTSVVVQVISFRLVWVGVDFVYVGVILFAVFVCWHLCCCVCAGVRLV